MQANIYTYRIHANIYTEYIGSTENNILNTTSTIHTFIPAQYGIYTITSDVQVFGPIALLPILGYGWDDLVVPADLIVRLYQEDFRTLNAH